VEDYNAMEISKVRKLSNAGTNPAGNTGADHFNALLNKAIELGACPRFTFYSVGWAFLIRVAIGIRWIRFRELLVFPNLSREPHFCR
jgi:hypothetical protein